MFPQKSIRGNFIVQLVVASVTLIGIFSTILYYYIKNTIYESITVSMEYQAAFIAKSKTTSNLDNVKIRLIEPTVTGGIVKAKIVQLKDKKPIKQFEHIGEDEINHKLILFYPLKDNPSVFIVLEREVNATNNLLDKILRNIFLINIFMIFIIVFYAFFLSRMLLVPIKTLGLKLAKMNEKYLNHVDTKHMYEEFLPLGESLNRLIDRVQTFIKYQTELFVGVAHELKTPLAVMKSKNQVTLIKPRDNEYYVEAIEKNVDSINEMNDMISAILEIGRQEGAQLKPPSVVDLVTFVKEKSNNFKILAKQENKDIALDIRPEAFPTLTQPTLVLHILQNFVQNAIKFSPENGTIIIQTSGNDDGFTIEVLDEGCGIDEEVDIFAPFKRFGNKGGVGLGLFLAKGAAQALNAQISVKNRQDMKGTISTLFIPRQQPIK